VLRAHEKLSDRLEDMDYEDGQVEERNGHDHQAKKSQQEETADHDNNYLGNGSQVKDKHSIPDELAGQATESGPRKGPALPRHLIGQVHDDNLKNLLMSWYYAGYYTGLYEGQQQGTQVSHAKPEN